MSNLFAISQYVHQHHTNSSVTSSSFLCWGPQVYGLVLIEANVRELNKDWHIPNLYISQIKQIPNLLLVELMGRNHVR